MKLKNVFKIGMAPFCAIALLACNNGGSKDGKVLVTFKNYDGVILQSERIEKGSDITYKQENVPSKPIQGSEIANVFVGWDKNLTNIQSDTTFNAVYKKLDKYVDNDHDGIPEGVDTNDNDNHFDVGAKSMIYLDQDINIDFSKFLESGSNKKYDNNIAKLALFLSNPKIDFKDGLFTDKAYGGRVNALYSRLGCDDYHHFDFKENEYVHDSKDTTSGVYAHKYLFDNSGNIVKDLIIIAFEGTNGKNRWYSNFDVGYNAAAYYDKTGGEAAHPEWDTEGKDYHKGFYIAAKRVLKDEVEGQPGPVRFLDYIEKHSSKSDGKPIVFVAGHSRGGAMANIVGEYLENKYLDNDGNQKCIPFTYAFASPAVWGLNTRPQTGTIFNILNTDDLVTKVPYSGWGFTRFGDETVSASVYDKYKEDYEKNRDGRKYDYVRESESIFENLGCTSRSEIYTIDNQTDKYLSNSELATFTEAEEGQGKVEEKMIELNNVYKSKLGDFTNFFELQKIKNYDYTGTAYYAIQANCCIATITSIAQQLMIGNQTFIDNLGTWIKLIDNFKFIEFVFSILLNIAGGGSDTVALPHDYGAYHIILKNYKEPTNK